MLYACREWVAAARASADHARDAARRAKDCKADQYSEAFNKMADQLDEHATRMEARINHSAEVYRLSDYQKNE